MICRASHNVKSPQVLQPFVQKLAVQERYNENTFLGVLVRSLEIVAERPRYGNYNVIQPISRTAWISPIRVLERSVSREFTPVFAKYSKLFSLINSLAAGVDRMQLHGHREWFEKSRREVSDSGLTCLAGALKVLAESSSPAAGVLLRVRYLTHLHSQASVHVA